MTEELDNQLEDLQNDLDAKEEEVQITRNPIFLSDNTMILITAFRSTSGLATLFMHDYINSKREINQAAEDIIKVLEPQCSVHMLWSLKEQIDKALIRHNEEFGTNFPLNKPDDKK